jgi:acetyl esterase
MTIHPQCQAILDVAAAGESMFDAPDVAEVRRRYLASTDIFAPPTPDMKSVEDRNIPGPDGDLPVRIFTPEGVSGPLPVLVFFHGGGWVVGDLDSHDAMCRILSGGAGCLVIAVDYRMGPEHPFPAAPNDAIAALNWAYKNAASLGGDPDRIAVGGDSAGGNLSAATTLHARDNDGPKLSFQLLIYPAVDMTETGGSRITHGEGRMLTTEAIDWFEERYLRDDNDRKDPRASPLLASDHSNLPPAFVLTAEYDPLSDEGKAYADALTAAGGQVQYKCYPGMLHGFARMGALVDMATDALADSAAALKDAFSA